MNILVVDDDDFALTPLLRIIEKAGVKVKTERTFRSAIRRIESSWGVDGSNFDLILIDLYIPITVFPVTEFKGEILNLADHYAKLARSQYTEHNKGQALGMWLWEKIGYRHDNKAPKHCYISNNVDRYMNTLDSAQQEFRFSEDESIEEIRKKFLISKPNVEVSKFKERLEEICEYWEKGMKKVKSNQS